MGISNRFFAGEGVAEFGRSVCQYAAIKSIRDARSKVWVQREEVAR
jgi:hypothetical protein